MTPSYGLALGFSTWTLLLLLCIGAVRLPLVFKGSKKANEFKPFGEDVSDFANRLCRAHANCYENLPIVLGILFVAAVTNHLAITNPLAWAFLGLRILQSLTHLISGSPKAAIIRFSFFAAQCAILIAWILQLWLSIPKIF